MSTNEIKQQLHELIDNCDNEFLLTEAKTLLQSSEEVKDWWDELDETDKNSVMEAETQYNNGKFINHRDLMQKFEAWRKK